MEDVEERLQNATRAMARVHAATLTVHASVDAAKAAAGPLLSAERVASAREASNEACNELIRLMGRADLGGTNHTMILRHLGVVDLWRARGVSRGFRRWAGAMLASLPRVVVVGGRTRTPDRTIIPSSAVEALDLSTMRWSSAGCMPRLPDPRCAHSLSCSAVGHVTVVGGFDTSASPAVQFQMCHNALQWLPRTSLWSALPDLPAQLHSAASVTLPDGRVIVTGGCRGQEALDSVLVLSADGNEWSELQPMTTPRCYHAATVLPDGKVFVVGGCSANEEEAVINSAELWDPATGAWSALPPMVHARGAAACCILPGVRVAVLGGKGSQGIRKDAELYDPVTQQWEQLGQQMSYAHGGLGAVAVPGGLIVVSVKHSQSNELYDVESGRWFDLPGSMMAGPSLRGAGVALIPASALETAH